MNKATQLLEELPSYDTPRKMVELALYLREREMPSVEALQTFLRVHGLGRYLENLRGDLHPRDTTGISSHIHRYSFVFPRHRLEDVRYLAQHIVSILMKDHPEMQELYKKHGMDAGSIVKKVKESLS